MTKKIRDINMPMCIYFLILALTALSYSLSSDIFANYFKDAYNITALQRGLIEFPREFPGVVLIFVVVALSFLSDIKKSIIAQLLSITGIAVMGLIKPSFYVMLVFIFINSLGMHIFLPIQDSIGLSLAREDNIGTSIGRFKGIYTAYSMIGAIIVFFGFRQSVFSFTSKVNWTFVIAALILIVVTVLLAILHRITHKVSTKGSQRVRFVFRKEYKYYYVLVILFGVQKQMMLVFGPWVLIEILGKKADTMALLGIAGSLLGVFFIPTVGRLLDRFGIKKILYLDALSYIGVYVLYGLMCAGFVSGYLAITGIPLTLAYILVIVDKMSTQMGIVRTVYLKTIAVENTDITPTLSLGVSMDHAVSIICAFFGGIVWSYIGPQYVFFGAAALSLINLFVAKKVKCNNV